MRSQALNGFDRPVPPSDRMFPEMFRAPALYRLMQSVVDYDNIPGGYNREVGIWVWLGKPEDAPYVDPQGVGWFASRGEQADRVAQPQVQPPQGLAWTHEALTGFIPMNPKDIFAPGHGGRWLRTVWGGGPYVWCPSPRSAIPYVLLGKADEEQPESDTHVVDNFVPWPSLVSQDAWKELYGRMLARWAWVAHWYLMRQTVDDMFYPRRAVGNTPKATTGTGGASGGVSGGGADAGAVAVAGAAGATGGTVDGGGATG